MGDDATKNNLPNSKSALKEGGFESGVSKTSEDNILNETDKAAAIICEPIKGDSPNLDASPTEGANFPSTKSVSTTDVSPDLETATTEGARKSEKVKPDEIEKTMSDAIKVDSLGLESSLTEETTESAVTNLNEHIFLNKTPKIASTKSIKGNSPDLETSLIDLASECEVAKSNEASVLNKTLKIVTTMSQSLKEDSIDSDTSASKAATKTGVARQIEENILNKIVTTMSSNDSSHAMEPSLLERANESGENIFSKTVKIVSSISESIIDDSLDLESSPTEISNKSEVAKPNEENILIKTSKIIATAIDSVKENSCDLEPSGTEGANESEEAKENDENISSKTSKFLATTHETTDDNSRDLEASFTEGNNENTVAELNEGNILTTSNEDAMEDLPATMDSTFDEDASENKISKPNEVPLNRCKELTTAEVTGPNMVHEIGNESDVNLVAKINISASPSTLDENNAIDTHKEAKRARIHSPPRKIYAVLKPPKDEATLNVLPTSGPVQSPEEIAKRIQSRFPASISVCVKTSVGTEDINNGSQRTANVTIEPKVGKITSTSISAPTTASSGSSAIGALCTPNSSATNISTTTRTNININNSTLCTPRDSTPSSTIAQSAAAPRTQLTTNKIIKVANIKTIKRLNKFALHYPPSIASNAIKSIAIRKAKSTVPPVILLARNCLLLPPKNPLSNSKVQVTSIKFLPRFTESNTAESNANPCCKLQTSTMVAIPDGNKPDLQEKPPDSSRYSFDNLTMLSHAEKPEHTAAASMPTFSYSYLRSLSAYISEAKAYYAKASKTCNTACGKDPLALDGINKQKQQLVAAGSSTQCQGGEKEECDAVKQLQANNENVIDLEDPLSLDAIPADISKEKQQLVGQDAEAHCQEDEKKKSDAIMMKVGAETTVDLEDIETDLVTYEIFNNGRDNVDGSSRNECTQTNESTMEVLTKISVLRETVKQQAEELVSLKAAMRFLNTKIDIENVSPVES